MYTTKQASQSNVNHIEYSHKTDENKSPIEIWGLTFNSRNVVIYRMKMSIFLFYYWFFLYNKRYLIYVYIFLKHKDGILLELFDIEKPRHAWVWVLNKSTARLYTF